MFVVRKSTVVPDRWFIHGPEIVDEKNIDLFLKILEELGFKNDGYFEKLEDAKKACKLINEKYLIFFEI